MINLRPLNIWILSLITYIVTVNGHDQGSTLLNNQGDLNKVVLKGSHLELPCFTETLRSSEALFQWKKDGSFLINTQNPISMDPRVSISTLNGSLKINNVTYKDEGLYLCEAFNYFETALLRITLYVIESHPRHHRFHSYLSRPHRNPDHNVAYLPILGISFVVTLFLIVNCYRKESSPHIPDFSETSLVNQFFSRACKGYQSLLLPKSKKGEPTPLTQPTQQPPPILESPLTQSIEPLTRDNYGDNNSANNANIKTNITTNPLNVLPGCSEMDESFHLDAIDGVSSQRSSSQLQQHQSDPNIPRIAYFDSIVVYCSESDDIGDSTSRKSTRFVS